MALSFPKKAYKTFIHSFPILLLFFIAFTGFDLSFLLTFTHPIFRAYVARIGTQDNSDFIMTFGSGSTFNKIKTSKKDWCFEQTIEALLSGTQPFTRIFILKNLFKIQNTTSQYNLIAFKQFSLEKLA